MMSSALTPDDIAILERTRKARVRVLDEMFKDNEVPSGRGIYGFTALVDSLDNNVIQQAKIRVDESSNKINEETKNVLTSLIKDLHNGVTPEFMSSEDEDIPSFKSTGMSVNEGELIRKTDNVGVHILDELSSDD